MQETSDREELARLWHLWCVRGVRHHHLKRLRAEEDLVEIWSRERMEVARRLRDVGFSKAVAGSATERIEQNRSPLAAFNAEHERLPSGGRIVFAGEADYPERLFDLEEPPTFLYVRGSLEACGGGDALAVVGSRDVTVEDARFARSIVSEIAEAGVRIVSGGAFGVDRASHEAALDAGTPTVVALPGGIDDPSPRSNGDVFERAETCGALVSEYPLGTDVRPYHFPRRNRIIAALAEATFIVRAGADSGTMLTADAAKEVGRPICVLPGDPREALTAGCLELLVEGAQAVRDGNDVLEIYFPGARADEEVDETGDDSPGMSKREVRERKLEQVSESARALVEILGDGELELDGAVELDEMAESTGWGASRIQSALLELELHGICEKSPGRQAYEF